MINDAPAVSVIIPAYNAERFILDTIKSIQDQRMSDLEIIVVDDGSTDQTVEYLMTIKDSRLKVFSYPNAGVSIARNRGISLASGKFISFLDADDLWVNDKLELQLKILNECHHISVVYSWTSYLHEGSGKLYLGQPVFFEGNVYPELLKWNFLASGSNPLIRREAIDKTGGFDPNLPPCEDWDFYIRLAVNHHFAVVPSHQVIYRQSPSSASANKIEFMEKQCLAVLEKSFQEAPQKYQYIKRKSIAWLYEYFTQLYLQNSNAPDGVINASKKLGKAVFLYPNILLEGYFFDLFKWLIKQYIQLLIRKVIVCR